MKVLINGAITELPEGTPLQPGWVLIPESTPTAANNIEALAALKKSKQWYELQSEFRLSADELTKTDVKLRMHTSAFGTSMFCDTILNGNVVDSTKVSSSISDAILGKTAAEHVPTVKVDKTSLTVSVLTKTAAAASSEAGKSLRDQIYRASFSWSL